MRKVTIGVDVTLPLLLGRVDMAQAADWYLRAEMGYEQASDADFADCDCSPRQLAALFGCAIGVDDGPNGAYGDFGGFPMCVFAGNDSTFLDLQDGRGRVQRGSGFLRFRSPWDWENPYLTNESNADPLPSEDLITSSQGSAGGILGLLAET